MAALLLIVVLLPVVGAFLALGPQRPAATARIGTAAALLSTLGAAVLLGRVGASGPVAAVWTSADGGLLGGLAVDRLTGILLLLVCAVSALVQGFAGRYLAGDRRLRWFVAGTGLLTTASAGLMCSVTLIGLAVCWSVAGFGLWLLLGTYPDLPAAQDGQRRAGAAFLLGDAALWAAVGIATVRWGNLDLRSLDASTLPGASGLVPLIGCLVVVAAASRSAQLPFRRWLPATLAAPTPVSALLHAGVVNAGGVLLVRLAPLASGSRLALGLTFAAGAATAAYGTVLMLTKPDIKGALAHSTMGQMGFMMMTCGLGLYAAAVIHLVLHGLYKASLFLASGSAIQRHVRHAGAPPQPALSPVTRRALTTVAVAMPGLLLWAVLQALHPTLMRNSGAVVLLGFAWATASATSLGWLRRHPHPRGLLAATAAAAIALTGYVALIAAADRFLITSLPVPRAALPATGWLVGSVLLAFALIAALSSPQSSRSPGWLGWAHRRIYVWSLSAGYGTRSHPRSSPRSGQSRQPTGSGWPAWTEAHPVRTHA